MKTYSIINYTGVKIGETINFYSRKDHTKIIRRKLSRKPLDTMRNDYIHTRLAYQSGNNTIQPLAEEILNLNPQIKKEMIKVQPKIFKCKYKTEWEEIELYQLKIEFEGETGSVSRPFYLNHNSDLKPDVWYLNDVYWYRNIISEFEEVKDEAEITKVLQYLKIIR